MFEWLDNVCIEDIRHQFVDWLKTRAACERAASYFQPGCFPHTSHKKAYLSVQSTLDNSTHVLQYLAQNASKVISQLQPSTTLLIACASAKCRYTTLSLKQQQDLSCVLASVTYRLLAFLPPSLAFVRDAMLAEFLMYDSFPADSPNIAVCVTAMLEMHGVTSSLHLTALLDKYI